MKTAADLRAERIRLHREMADVYRQSGLPEKAAIHDGIADNLAGLTRMDAEIEAVAAEVGSFPIDTRDPEERP